MMLGMQILREAKRRFLAQHAQKIAVPKAFGFDKRF